MSKQKRQEYAIQVSEGGKVVNGVQKDQACMWSTDMDIIFVREVLPDDDMITDTQAEYFDSSVRYINELTAKLKALQESYQIVTKQYAHIVCEHSKSINKLDAAMNVCSLISEYRNSFSLSVWKEAMKALDAMGESNGS